VYRVACTFQVVPNEIGDVPAVLDDQHLGHGRILMDRADAPC
jgi:hypothetical protein